MLPLRDQVKALCRKAELGDAHALAEYRAILSVVLASLPQLLASVGKPEEKKEEPPPLIDLPPSLQLAQKNKKLVPLVLYLQATPVFHGHGYAKKFKTQFGFTKGQFNRKLKPYSFTLQRIVDDAFLAHAKAFLLTCPDDSIDQVAERLNIGLRQFERKFKSLTGLTPKEFRRHDKQ